MGLERIDNKNLYRYDGSGGSFYMSYDTPIIFLKDGIAYATGEYFSQTTSSHYNYIMRNLHMPVKMCTFKEFKKMVLPVFRSYTAESNMGWL